METRLFTKRSEGKLNKKVTNDDFNKHQTPVYFKPSNTLRLKRVHLKDKVLQQKHRALWFVLYSAVRTALPVQLPLM